MSYDMSNEEDVKAYLENVGLSYRFGCYKEKNPQCKFFHCREFNQLRLCITC